MKTNTCRAGARREAKGPRLRSILHVDLDPFLVAVERALDATLTGRPVVVGGAVVAAASAEARACGVRAGQHLTAARRLCPGAAFRPGDLEAYARFGDDVTTILLSTSRRVERPSTDEAYVDLTPESPDARAPVAAAEAIRDAIQRRLGLDASLGLASSRLAAQVASAWAKPRGLLVVLPGYESAFLASRPLSALPDLPPHLETALARAGFDTLGRLADADETALAAVVGPAAARRLQSVVRGEDEPPIAVATPPLWVRETAKIRDRGSDREVLLEVLDGLVRRAYRRLQPFGLTAGALAVEVVRAEGIARRCETQGGVGDDAEAASTIATALAAPLFEPASGVTAMEVRLTRLGRPAPQASLFH